MRTPLLFPALLLAAACVTPAAADQPRPAADAWVFESCVAEHAACAESCRETGEGGKGGAGCLVACASAEVECVAAHTASKVTPWIERKTEQFRNFLDEFLRDLPVAPDDPTPPAPAPRRPPSGNGDFDST